MYVLASSVSFILGRPCATSEGTLALLKLLKLVTAFALTSYEKFHTNRRNLGGRKISVYRLELSRPFLHILATRS